MGTRIYQLELDQQINSLITIANELFLMQAWKLQFFQRLRQAVELGRLTEDIFPPAKLYQVRSLVARYELTLLEPLWYYEHVIVYPLYVNDKQVVYRAYLPLLDNHVYRQFTIRTWPIFYNDSSLAIELDVPEVIGFNTKTGVIFQPERCLGRQPRVCHNTPTYAGARDTCVRGLISRDDTLLKRCQVKIYREFPMTTITEVALNQYVIVTPGERVTHRCPGMHEQPRQLAKGTYLLTLKPPCTLSGNDWTVHSIQTLAHNVSFQFEKEPYLSLNLMDKLPEMTVEKLITAMHLDLLPDIDTLPLDKIPTVPPMPWMDRLPDPAVTSTSISITVIGIMITLWCCRQHIQRCFDRCKKDTTEKTRK